MSMESGAKFVHAYAARNCGTCARLLVSYFSPKPYTNPNHDANSCSKWSSLANDMYGRVSMRVCNKGIGCGGRLVHVRSVNLLPYVFKAFWFTNGDPPAMGRNEQSESVQECRTYRDRRQQ